MAFVVIVPPQTFAVLHEFAPKGHHRRSRVEPHGDPGDPANIASAEAKARTWVGALANVVREDIAVELFDVDCDGHTFGLVDASFEDDDGAVELRAELVPQGLVFAPPWDGTYDT